MPDAWPTPTPTTDNTLTLLLPRPTILFVVYTPEFGTMTRAIFSCANGLLHPSFESARAMVTQWLLYSL